MTLQVWNGTNGSWATASNWHPAGVPGPGDVADITSGVVDINGADTSRRTIVVNAVRGDITTGLTVDNTSTTVAYRPCTALMHHILWLSSALSAKYAVLIHYATVVLCLTPRSRLHRPGAVSAKALGERSGPA